VKANPTALAELCAAYCLENGPTISPVSGTNDVYIVVMVGEQRSLAPIAVAWPVRSIGLYIPVSQAGQTAFIAPLELVDSAQSAITGRELEGRNTWLADLCGAWCADGDAGSQALLSARALTFAGPGGKAASTELVAIRGAPDGTGNPASPRLRASPSVTDRFRALHLKQYRDAVDPQLAVYQRITSSTVRVVRVHESGSLPRMIVRAPRSKMFSVVSALLGTAPLEPTSAVWLRADLKVEASPLLAQRG